MINGRDWKESGNGDIFRKYILISLTGLQNSTATKSFLLVSLSKASGFSSPRPLYALMAPYSVRGITSRKFREEHLQFGRNNITPGTVFNQFPLLSCNFHTLNKVHSSLKLQCTAAHMLLFLESETQFQLARSVSYV
jgi:hypothetical protein